MRALTRRLLWVLPAIILLTFEVYAANGVIRGLVTDSAGKPIRGAIVQASSNEKSVDRYTQSDGRYEIGLAAGTYSVSVRAFGFAAKRQTKDTSEASDTNFSLSPKMDVMNLTGAEIESLLPSSEDATLVKTTCVDCHSLDWVLRKRGSTASEWREFLPRMVRDRMIQRNFGERLVPLANALEKYFGPDAPYFGPDSEPPTADQVPHAKLADAALSATLREYTVPKPGVMPHSIMADRDDIAWFSEFDYQTNAIGRFDLKTEEFSSYPLPLAKSVPHTGVVDKDGRIWMALTSVDVPAKLASVDPATGQLKTYDFPGKRNGTHTLAVDPQGNIWSSGSQVYEFDAKQEKFQAYDVAKGFVYDIKVDPKGIVWLNNDREKQLISLDPATGQRKEYKVPLISSFRGLLPDGNGNIWFSNFNGHTLSKLDPETGEIKDYHPPTPNATPYGIVVDAKTGYLYFGDLSGNQITRFDPKTEQFVEYPIASPHAYSRFIGIDTKGRIWFSEFMTSKIGVLDPGDGFKQATVSP